MRSLTKQQQDIAEKNHNLIYKFLYKNNLQVSEWYGVAAIGLCKAARDYQPGRGTFSTLAFLCMRQAYLQEIGRINKSGKVGEDISLDEPVFVGEDGSEINRLDCTPDALSIEDDVIFNVDMRLAISQLDQRQLTILKLLFSGYKHSEIGAVVGISQPYVSRLSRRAISTIFSDMPLPKRKARVM